MISDYNAIKFWLYEFYGIQKIKDQALLEGSNFSLINVPHSEEVVKAIITRLYLIKKYEIAEKKLITNILIHGLSRDVLKLTNEELLALREIVANPNIKLKDIANKLKVSISKAHRLVKRLRQKTKFRKFVQVDYTIFKLRHYVVYFQIFEDMIDYVEILKKIPFLITINTDTYALCPEIREGWMTLLWPSHRDSIKFFFNWIRRFKTELGVFERYKIFDLKAIGFNINMELFDGQNWQFWPDIHTISSLNFIRKHENLISPPNLLRYSFKPIRFKKTDLLMISVIGGNIEKQYKDAIENLRSLGINIGKKEFNDIKKKLLMNSKVYTLVPFNNLADSLMLFIDANPEHLSVLQKYFMLFPSSWIGISDTGMLAFIELPRGDALDTLQVILNVLSEITNRVNFVIRYANRGSRAISEAARFWNEKEQKWEIDYDWLLQLISQKHK